jgi:hypothetical protein
VLLEYDCIVPIEGGVIGVADITCRASNDSKPSCFFRFRLTPAGRRSLRALFPNKLFKRRGWGFDTDASSEVRDGRAGGESFDRESTDEAYEAVVRCRKPCRLMIHDRGEFIPVALALSSVG